MQAQVGARLQKLENVPFGFTQHDVVLMVLFPHSTERGRTIERVGGR